MTKKTTISTIKYVERVNLAIDLILDRVAKGSSPGLSAVAAAAGLSPYHFHRVFQMLVGSTVADFAMARRLDRALVLMSHRRRIPLAGIASLCGFSSASDFSRSFKRAFGVAPSRFDLAAWRSVHRAKLEALAPSDFRIDSLPTQDNPDGFKVRIRELPSKTVAYIRVSDPYKSNAVPLAADALLRWARERQLAGGAWFGYQWENPEITPLERCCYHVAVEAANVTPAGNVGRFRFPAMLVAQVEIKGPIDLELRALHWLYGVWLPRSGYVPDDHPCFEAWIGQPFAHGTSHFELNIQLPIKRT